MSSAPPSPPSAYTEQDFIVSFTSPYVLHIQINRPQKLNAFHQPLWYALRRLFDCASRDEDVRAIVLSATGRAFTAGLDITEPGILTGGASDAARRAQACRHHILDFQDAISSIQRCAKPVIVVLHGLTYGLGIDIAAAADVRYAAADTRMCIKEVDVGLAADIGSLQRLPYSVGSSSWMRELALTAREFGAEEAHSRGFISRICATRERGVYEALETAQLMASKSPVAIQGTKFLLDYSRDHTVQEGLLMTAVWNASMLQARDVPDAITGILTKSPAKFSKL